MSNLISQLQHWFVNPKRGHSGAKHDAVTAQPPFAHKLQSAPQLLSGLCSNGVTLTLSELLRYQRHTPWYDLTPRQMAQNKLAGSYLSRIKGRGMEFDEVRHYQNGDDVRSIDWRVTARTGKVHTKLFREERERPVFIVTDVGSSMQFGSQLLFKSVQAAHVAALAAFAVLERGDKLGGVIVGEQLRDFKPAGRSAAVLRYINGLVELHNQCLASSTEAHLKSPSLASAEPRVDVPNAGVRKTDINAALAQLRQLCRPGSLLVIISDFSALDHQGWAHLEMLTRHNEIKFTQIVDPLEFALPKQSDAEIVVASTVPEHANTIDTTSISSISAAQSISASLADARLQQQYQQQQAAWFAQVDHQCRRLGIKRQRVSAGEPLLQQLQQANTNPAYQGGPDAS